MKILRLAILPLFTLFIWQNVQGQGVRRSVIASLGDSGTPGGFYLSCTAGQPPNAGTIDNGGYFLRQGFQQPVSMPSPDCMDAPMAEFIVDDRVETCGQYFDFQYAGVPDATTTFHWNFGPNAVPLTSNEANPTDVVFTALGNQLITLEVTTDSCVFLSFVNVESVETAFTVNSNIIDVDCAGDKNGAARLIPLNGQVPYSYQWATGDLTDEVSGLAAGSYDFTVTEGQGCSYEGQVTIGGPDSILVTFITTAETCTGKSDGAIEATLSGGQMPYILLWSNGAITEDLNNIPGGDYAIGIIDAHGCQAAFKVNVPINCEGIVFDNVITPNNDGANDAWTVPQISNFPNNELEIFNRWGNRVFHKKNYDNSWYGTNSSGQPLPAGAYFYVLRLNDAADTVHGGSITILK